jgi:hypothetical protein
MRPIGVGTADFKLIKSQNNFLIDKSMLIDDILNSVVEVFLFPRPRRFGKSLNISLLKYFFEKTEKSNLTLFTDLQVAQHPHLMAHQGQYPVIDLSFKDVKHVANWEEMSAKFQNSIAEEYIRHKYILETLNEFDKKYFDKIVNRKSSVSEFKDSIYNLSKFLFEYHQQKVVLLIDEYDTPLNDAYLSGLLTEARTYISTLYGTALKGNNYLFKAVLTGIYRISKESIFSGLNNLKVCSILDNLGITQFGFTEAEMESIFTEYQFTDAQKNECTSWYNGYIWGKNQTVIYNPWSIVNYLSEDFNLKAHWVNTSANDLIKEMINNCSIESKKDFEVLLQGGSVSKPIIEDVVFDHLIDNEDVLWSFFFFSGYLKIIKQYQIDDKPYGDFQIVNRELKSIFKDSVDYWFNKSQTKGKFDVVLDNLVKNNLEDFAEYFTEFITKVTSYYDFADKEPERVYHALVLGMMVNLQSKYRITSNRESGFGRYDIMLHPLQENLPAYIFEFKKHHQIKEQNIDETLQNAMSQIKTRNYAATLQQEGFQNIELIAIAFKGKEVKLCWEKVV